MTNWKWMTATCIASAALLIGASTASPVQDAPGANPTPPTQQSQPDKRYTGQVAIRITGNLVTNVIDEGRIHQILNGGEGFDAVVKKVLGVTLPGGGIPEYSSWVGFDGGSKGRDGILTARIKIQIPNTGDARRAADAILAELPVRIRGVLQREYQRNVERLRSAIADLEGNVREGEQRFEQLGKLEVELREQAGQAELSREGVLRMIRDYEEKKRDTELLVATQAARRQAISKQMAQLARSAEEAVQRNPVATELQKVVEIRGREVDKVRTLVDSGSAPTTDLDRAVEGVALARAEFAKARAAAAQAAGGDLIAKLNADLVQLSIDSEEGEARLALLRERLADAQRRKLLELAERYEREVVAGLDGLRTSIATDREQLRMLQQQLQSAQEPEVTVLDK